MLVDQWDLGTFRRDGRALIVEGTHLGRAVTVLKPQTYMNRSGIALEPLLRTDEFSARDDLLVLVDDFALPLGSFRIRARGSAGGHNGLESIESHMQSQDYARLRIGVGPVPDATDRATYVLEAFSKTELDQLTDVIPLMHDAVECWLVEGVDEAMNQFNGRGQRE